MLALASLVMSLILKFLEIAMKTKTGTAGVGGIAAGLGAFMIGWSTIKLRELYRLHQEVCDPDKQGFTLFSWLSPTTIAKNHEAVINWLKLQGADIQDQYRKALA